MERQKREEEERKRQESVRRKQEETRRETAAIQRKEEDRDFHIFIVLCAIFLVVFVIEIIWAINDGQFEDGADYFAVPVAMILIDIVIFSIGWGLLNIVKYIIDHI